MPVNVKYADNGSGVLLLGSGIVKGREIVEANEEAYSAEERLSDYRYTFVEMTDLEGIDVTMGDIRDIVEINKEAASVVTHYFVGISADEDFQFGFARMWENLTSTQDLNWESIICRDSATAKDWLKEKMKEKYGTEITFE